MEAPAADSAPVAQPALPLAVAACFIGLTALLTVFAGPVSLYLDETAREIMAPAGYIAAVLGPDALAAR